MKKIDLTREIPELIGLIEISLRVDQMEAMLQTAKEAQKQIATEILHKLMTYEQVNGVWLGKELVIEYDRMQFVVQGLNNDKFDAVHIIPIDHLLVLKNKQTKSTEGEKEKS